MTTDVLGARVHRLADSVATAIDELRLEHDGIASVVRMALVDIAHGDPADGAAELEHNVLHRLTENLPETMAALSRVLEDLDEIDRDLVTDDDGLLAR